MADIKPIKQLASDTPEQAARIKEINIAITGLQDYVDSKIKTATDNIQTLPVGTVIYIMSATEAPDGFIEGEGQAVLISDYSALAESRYVGDANNSNTSILSGYKCTNPANPNGSRSTSGTYIVLPDLRGMTLKGKEASRAINSFEAHQLQDHGHSSTGSGVVNVPQAYWVANISSTWNDPPQTNGNVYGSISIGSPNSGNHGTKTLVDNLAFLGCIKY